MVKEEFKLLKVAKYKCLESLQFFTRYLYKKNHNKKFIIGDHHNVICNALEKVLTGEITRLIINVAPRYSKTELAVKNFIAHGLAHNPAAKFIHLSYSDTLALDNSEEIKDMVQSEAYQELFSNVQVKRDSKAKKKWYTTQGGGIYATAAAGQVTGFGAGEVDPEEEEDDEQTWIDQLINTTLSKAGFGGAIVIDDPIKPEDADSEVMREKVNQRFDSTIRNRVNSRNTPIIIIMQRLHPNDLCGHVLEKEPGVWTVISLPAIREVTEGETKKQVALWPHKHTLEELLHLRKINDIVFERQYQQNPKPKEGLLFAEDELHYYNPKTTDLEKLAEYRFSYIDPADEGGDDLSAPVGYLVGDKIYVPYVIFNQHGTDVNESACVSMFLNHKCNAGEIEGNSAWILFGKAVRAKVEEKTQDCEIRIIKNTTNKHTRILAQSSFIKNHFVFRSDYAEHPDYYRFMQNLTSYMRIQTGSSRNKHEDAPDSCAGMAAHFQKNFAHLY
jgi:predicted phage terminase large subunit-like protein